MGMWAGIERGYATHEAKQADREDREYKRRREERLEEEFNESKFLRRSKTLLDYLGPRGSRISVDSAKFAEIKRAIGDIEGANDYLAKLAVSPYAVDTVHAALKARQDATQTELTGQELLDNVVLIAENYGTENWKKQYEEGRNIYEILLQDPEKLLDDEYYTGILGRIGALDDVVKPTVGVQITPGFTSKLTVPIRKQQVEQFDNALELYANNLKDQGVQGEFDPKLDKALEAFKDGSKTELRKFLGPIVLHQLIQSGDSLWKPGLSGILKPFTLESEEIQNLKQAAETSAREEAIRKFDEIYGPGSAEIILGM
tara:strand:+ start:2520 stop:3464 length:945 start_codon:yes stop_codon:yes gene_type:complete